MSDKKEQSQKIDMSEHLVKTQVSLPIFVCGKCRIKMEYWDGCAMGAYGVDIENCDDPQYKCSCGNSFYIEEKAK